VGVALGISPTSSARLDRDALGNYPESCLDRGYDDLIVSLGLLENIE